MSPSFELEPTVHLQGLFWFATAGVTLAALWLTRKRPDYGVALVLAALPLYQIRGTIGIPVTLLELILWAVLVGLASHGRKFLPSRTPYDFPLLLFVGGSLLAALGSVEPVQALGLWRAFIFEPVLWFYAAVTVYRHYAPTALLHGALVGLAGIVLGTSLRIATGDALSYDFRLLGPFQSPNYLALILVPLILLTFTWPGRHWLVLRVFLVGIGLGILLASSSLGGILAIVAGLGAWLAFRYVLPQKRVLLGIWLAAILAAMAVIPFVSKPHEGGDPRPFIWEEAARQIEERPVLGSGPDQFQHTYGGEVQDERTKRIYVYPYARTAHNLLLATWVEWGLITLLGLLALLFYYVRTIWRSPLAFTSIAVLTAVLVHGIVDTPVYKNDLALLFMLPFVLSLVPANKRKRVA